MTKPKKEKAKKTGYVGRMTFEQGEPIKASNFANGEKGLSDMVNAGMVVEG
jgi:hypothetical protein